MPISQKQLIANQQNAQNSTGPRTLEGKIAASRNAITHGLHAGDTVIKSPHLNECQFEYDELMNALIEELRPEGVLQHQLVRKITNCLWRQRRAMNAETAYLNRELATQSLRLSHYRSTGPHYSDPTNPETITQSEQTESNELANLASARSIPTGNFCLALLRYELRLDTQLARTYKLLKHLQSKIKGETEKISFLDI